MRSVHLRRAARLLIVRGSLAVIIGVLAFVSPRLSVFILILLFGLYVLLEGGMSLVESVRARSRRKRWWALLARALAALAAAAVPVMRPRLALIALIWVIALWAIIAGVIEIFTAARLENRRKIRWAQGVGGAASIAFGILIAVEPASGALAVVLWLAAYLIVSGCILISSGLRVRSQHREASAASLWGQAIT